jgi:hypothetical protein
VFRLHLNLNAKFKCIICSSFYCRGEIALRICLFPEEVSYSTKASFTRDERLDNELSIALNSGFRTKSYVHFFSPENSLELPQVQGNTQSLGKEIVIETILKPFL